MSNFQVDRAKWMKLDIYEQMGNIGSEVGRAINAQRNGKVKRVDTSALDRALFFRVFRQC